MIRKFLTCLALAALTALGYSDAQAQVASGTVTITPNSSAYSAGFCLGGVQAVSNLVVIGHDGGTILSNATIVDNTGTNAQIDLVVFNAAPAGTYTDHAACTISAADQAKISGFIGNATFTAITDSAGTTGIELSSPALSVTTTGPNGGKPSLSTLWFLPIVRSTPTYGSSKTLTLTVYALPD